jgi:uncharacterized protein YjbI with pentapeptide repeats
MNEYSNAQPRTSDDARWLGAFRKRRDDAIEEDVMWSLTAKQFAQAYALGERNFENVDIRNADLRGADLAGAKLCWATLENANLSEANLSNAWMTRANLALAQMSGANLEDALLREAILTGVELVGANLTDARLIYAWLAGANLEGANLNNANLTGARLIGTNLKGADLENTGLDSADFTRANLTGARLTHAHLRYTNFNDAILDGTCLDPLALVPKTDLSAFKRTQNGKLIGYRTSRSVHVTGHNYEPGQSYLAPFFSKDTGTDCHPGLYVLPDLESARALAQERQTNIVVVHIDPAHAMRTVGGNYRCKAFTVVKEIPVN